MDIYLLKIILECGTGRDPDGIHTGKRDRIIRDPARTLIPHSRLYYSKTLSLMPRKEAINSPFGVQQWMG
jgi:hypothetical protein